MRLLSPLLDLLFPPRCVFCQGREGIENEIDSVCESCLGQVMDPQNCCLRCAFPKNVHWEGCPVCGEREFAFTKTCAVSLYQGSLKTVIYKYKYKGNKNLAGPLGQLVARQVRSSGWPQLDAVIPIPLHPDKLLERGYDQALLLAQVIGSELGLPVKQCLIRTKATRSQTKLGASERWSNVADAFAPISTLELPKQVLLVDDLLTTGATAHFASLALKQGKAKEVFLAVVAR